MTATASASWRCLCTAAGAGAGVGTALVAAAIGWVRDHGLHKLCLEVFAQNAAAITLCLPVTPLSERADAAGCAETRPAADVRVTCSGTGLAG